MKNQFKILLIFISILTIGCSKDDVNPIIPTEPDEFTDCRETIAAYDISMADANGLIEGDIIPDKSNKALVNLSEGKLWKNNIVPYFLDSDWSYWKDEVLQDGSEEKQNQIRQRLQFIQSVTYLEFVEFTDKEEMLKKYKSGIHFRSPINPFTGNSSSVGMRGGIQDLTLVYNSKDYVIEHEVFHALGFSHEIKRADRDEHIIMLWDNIPINPSIRRQFKIEADAILCGDYDIKSLMHYGSYHGGWWNAEETNRPVYTDLDGKIIEQPTKLSEKDIETVKILYPKKL